jgi:hypothetical protein
VLYYPLRTRLRVRRAPGIPHALSRGERFYQSSDASRRGNAGAYLYVIARSESDEAIHLLSWRGYGWLSLRSQ